MKKDMVITVRKDGTINIGKKARAEMGLISHSKVSVSYGDGSIVIKPLGFKCKYCGGYTSRHNGTLGECLNCKTIADELFRAKKINDYGDALAKAGELNRKGAKSKV